MMEPAPRCRVAGTAYFIPSHTPFWLMLTIESHSSSLVSSCPSTFAMPALLTRISKPPSTTTTLDCGRPVGSAGDVEMQRDDRFRADLGIDIGGLAALVVEHVPDHDLGARANEKAGFSSALSSRAAGNQSNFAFEPIHGVCLVGLSFICRLSSVVNASSKVHTDRRFTSATRQASFN